MYQLNRNVFSDVKETMFSSLIENCMLCTIQSAFPGDLSLRNFKPYFTGKLDINLYGFHKGFNYLIYGHFVHKFMVPQGLMVD